ncbi:MAG: PadR family transcriptional regulator [bacterium]|nr:PadR family transcriptional regulator [bacterium]
MIYYVEGLNMGDSLANPDIMSKADVTTKNLTKSCNEALILISLAAGPRHGYQLALDIEERSNRFFGFKHGTLYPILHKLEKEGLIKGVWSEEGPRGKRKSYALTNRGSRYALEQRESWRVFLGRFIATIGEGD